MKSSTTESFWRAYHLTSAREIQTEARKGLCGWQRAALLFRLWQQNPRHPSLRFERKGDYWSVRITRGWRALARFHEGTLYWFWIGSHDEYERLLKR